MTDQTREAPRLQCLRAIRAGEVRARWAWTEPGVWTERMLTALEDGVQGGVWYSLMDKVYAPATLYAAFTRVKANDGAAGVDHVTVAMFEDRLDENLQRLARELKDGSYRPQAVRRVWIPKPGRNDLRPLGVPTVRDRVVQTALRSVLEPIFEREFAEHSYGFRPGRGCQDALRRVADLLTAGYTWVVDADLKSYFDTLPHQPLLTRVRTKVTDGRVLALVEAFLNQTVQEGENVWTPETGSPQGAVISPLLSNLYLDPLDHLMAQTGYEMVRYADDFVVLCRTEEDARRALEVIRAWVTAAGLTLHPEKTRIVNALLPRVGFDFLGYHFEGRSRTPSEKSQAKLKTALRECTPRLNGHSLRTIIDHVNQKLRGWFAYFRNCWAREFKRLDTWLRMRLRRILRKRLGRSKGGRVKGHDEFRWPNRYFAAQGLFSLSEARRAVSQSSAR